MRWLTTFCTVARNAGWNPSDCILNFRMYINTSTKHWYNTRSKDERRDWSLLAKAFKAEFCTGGVTLLDQYYDAIQNEQESAREYLWRFNDAAKKAGIDYRKDKKNGILKDLNKR